MAWFNGCRPETGSDQSNDKNVVDGDLNGVRWCEYICSFLFGLLCDSGTTVTMYYSDVIKLLLITAYLLLMSYITMVHN